MRIARLISKATDSLSEYGIPTAFPQQQWLQDHAQVLRYTCIARLVKFYSRGK